MDEKYKTMKTNLEKWDVYASLLKQKTDDYINERLNGKHVPDKYYIITPVGNVSERIIKGTTYSHHKHGGRDFFNGKKPTRKDVEAIRVYATSEIPFAIDNAWFSYSELWGGGKYTSSSSVSINNVINKIDLYHSIGEAELESVKIKLLVKEDKEFMELHKKDHTYNYPANGYKFLGWQNGWKSVYYDEDGELCSKSGKPHKTFGYTEEDYPEYKKCINAKHRRIEESRGQRGYENTVSCPLCKIYWKYDCSD